MEHIIQPEPFDGHSIPKIIKRWFKKICRRLRVAQFHDDIFKHKKKYGWPLKDANDSYLGAGFWVCVNDGFDTKELVEWIGARVGLWLGSWWPWRKDKK